jgi:Na+/H+ antiporter NhaD/arsenite permease-like protein
MAALLIFAGTYFLIAVQQIHILRLNRPAAALLGAVLMVLVGGLSLPEAYAAVDLDVLVFLLGLMLLVGHLELGGFFQWSAAWIIRRAGTPRQLLVGVVVGSGILSAFFVNDTVCLMLTPVLLAATAVLGLRPTPYLIGLAMGSNVGSLLTFTGNPQNMLIGLWSGIRFGRFTWLMLPVVAGGLTITCAVLLWLYRKELSAAALPMEVRLTAAGSRVPVNRPIVFTALALFGGAVVAWMAGGSLPLVAIAAGTLMLAVARRDPTDALERVEWSLLLFFGALFVVMRGLEHSGAVALINREALGVVSTGGSWASALATSGVMVVLSNLISNVPAVLLWRTVVPQLPHPEAVWLVMAMAATFAGNLLLIGSMANLIVAERAESRGVRMGYWEYARAGVPVTLLTVLWGIVVLVWST